MAGRGFTSVSLPNEVVERIDEFINHNEWGYRSRADVITQAVRDFIRRETQHPEKR